MFFWILVLLALAASAIGFYKYVYFISVGYGFAIAVIGLALLVRFHAFLSPATALLSLLLVVYGARLSSYLIIREVRSSSYRSTMKKEIKSGDSVGFGVKIAIWLTVAILYALETCPVLFRLSGGNGSDAFAGAGALIMACGMLLEAASDLQKSALKKKNPNRFCDSGLFKLVRCPNYLGEVLTWTGVFISGINIYSGLLQWLAALAGYVCIVYIMFGGARRLEIRQNRNYGADPEYQNYVKTTPILLPFVPLYSVEKYKWLVG